MFFSSAMPASCSYAIMATIVALVVLERVPSAANAAAVAGRGGDAGSGTGADALPVLPVSNISVPQVQLQRSARGEGDAPLQPLPPNTGMSLVADVPGTTVANDAFWAEKCTTIPSTARGITVDMGAVSVVVCRVCVRARVRTASSCPLTQDITAPFYYACARVLSITTALSVAELSERGASQPHVQYPDARRRARSTKMLTCSDDTN